MNRNIAIAGLAAVVVLGGGTAAYAASTSSGATPTPSASAAPSGSGSASAKAAHPRLVKLGARGVRAQVVTRGKNGTFVTHDTIRGQVIAVSATSIGVKAADGTTETFTVSSATKVRMRTAGKGAPSSIGLVKTGDTVLVLGTGTGPFAAQHVVDVKK
jgi:hypothetical protein